MFKNIRKKIKNVPVNYFFLLLFAVNLILIVLGMIFYNGKFSFWDYPFSYLGAVNTIDGVQNRIASSIYRLDMILSGLIMFAVSYNFYLNKKKNLFKALLSFSGGIGFLVASFNPDDTRHIGHVMGSALAVFSLWVMATNYLLEMRRRMKKTNYFLLQLILQIPIFAYAGTYFLAIEPLSTELQKVALFSLGFILLYSTRQEGNFAKKS